MVTLAGFSTFTSTLGFAFDSYQTTALRNNDHNLHSNKMKNLCAAVLENLGFERSQLYRMFNPLQNMNEPSRLLGTIVEVAATAAINFFLPNLIGRVIQLNQASQGLRLVAALIYLSVQNTIISQIHFFVKTASANLIGSFVAPYTTERWRN